MNTTTTARQTARDATRNAIGAAILLTLGIVTVATHETNLLATVLLLVWPAVAVAVQSVIAVVAAVTVATEESR